MNNEIKLKLQAIPFAAHPECMSDQIPYEHIKSLITKVEPYKVYISAIEKDGYINMNKFTENRKEIYEKIDKTGARYSFLVNGLDRIESTFVIRYYLAYLHNCNVGIGGDGYDDKIDMNLKLEDMKIVLVFDDEAYKRYEKMFTIK